MEPSQISFKEKPKTLISEVAASEQDSKKHQIIHDIESPEVMDDTRSDVSACRDISEMEI